MSEGYLKNIRKRICYYLSCTLGRQILMTKCCGKAWESISSNSVIRGFKKCSLSTSVDGSKNQQLHSEKIPDVLSNAPQ